MSNRTPDPGILAAVRGSAATPLDEYQHLGDDLRHYGILRLYRLTLLLGTTGAMVTAVASDNVRSHPLLLEAVKWGGLAITLAFAIMDYRSGNQWTRLQARANELAAVLGFQARARASVESVVDHGRRSHPAHAAGAGLVRHGRGVAARGLNRGEHGCRKASW